MLGARLFLLPVCLLHVVILIESRNAEAAEKTAFVAGAPSAKLRSGAGFEHAREAMLNAASAQQPKPSTKNLAAAEAEEPQAGAGKSPSILQMLEGREDELMIAAAGAAAFFFIGWICGGNYYLRRERKRRNKIRF